jgi:hypothetical protein
MTEIFRHDDDTAEPPFPWPPPRDEPVLAAFGQTWKEASFDPGRFFRRLPRTGGTGPAVLYYLVIGILVAGASLFWDVVRAPAGEEYDRMAELGVQFDPLVVFLLSPLILLLALGIAAGVTHFMLLILRGANRPFNTTIRVFAFAYSPMIFGVVPLIGTLVGTLWMLVIAITGLAAAHETPAWKPVLAVLLPFLMLVTALIFAVLALVAAGAAILG